MKPIFHLLLVLFFCPQVYPQKSSTTNFKYKAVYELTYQPDSTDASSVTSEEMWLYFGEEGSKFTSKGKALRDSLTSTASLSSMGNFQSIAERTRTEFDYILLKDFPEDKITYTIDKIRNKLRYEEDKDLFTWEILPETRNIKGYDSQKATTTFRGREYTAWFTSEIPISDGPYKFSGLPGLILEIRDSRDHYIFELIQFNALLEPIEFSLNTANYTLTSRDNLLRLTRKIEEDPFAALENTNNGSSKTVTIEIDQKQKREHLKKIRKELEKKNNPTELE